MERRKFNYESGRAVYNGFIDQDPEPDSTPFTSEVEDAYFWALEHGRHEAGFRALGDGFEVEAAYLAGVDLHEGKVERGNTDMLTRWVAGGSGHISFPHHAFSRFAVKHLNTYPADIAIRYKDVVYFMWGGIPGHAFPKGCVPYRRVDSPQNRAKPWGTVAKALRTVFDFDRASYLSRRHQFHKVYDVIERGEVPADIEPSRAYIHGGVLGLIRYYFRGRWSAAVEGLAQPPKGMSHMRLVMGYGQKKREYVLCDLDEAVHLLMASKANPLMKIHDLNTPVEGI